jgi:uncharacterized protein (DUF58 family)
METMVVMPAVVPLPTVQIAAGGLSGEGRERSGIAEPTVAAARVRDYRPGDSARSIHWRTSARRAALYVRQFESASAGDWWIILDANATVQAGSADDSTLEHAIILAASLADRGLRTHHAVGLIAEAPETIWLPPRADEAQRWEILRALTTVQPGALALADVLARVRGAFTRPASLIVITPDAGLDWVAALLPAISRGSVPTVMLLDPKAFGGDADGRFAHAAIREMGIECLRITPDLLNAPERRAGRQGHWDWRISGTGRAIAVHQPQDFDWKAVS